MTTLTTFIPHSTAVPVHAISGDSVSVELVGEHGSSSAPTPIPTRDELLPQRETRWPRWLDPAMSEDEWLASDWDVRNWDVREWEIDAPPHDKAECFEPADFDTDATVHAMSCPWCQGHQLHDLPSSVWCKDCESVAWVAQDDRLVRADQLEQWAAPVPMGS